MTGEREGLSLRNYYDFSSWFIESSVMNLVNRVAMVLTPKQPYYQWAKTFDVEDLLSTSPRSMTTVYLVPAFGGQSSDQDVIEDYFEHVFEDELRCWTEKSSDWPEVRSVKVFLDWFEVSIAELVMDVKKAPFKYIK